MGGEFVRVRMLQGQAPVASLVASVMVAKLTQTMALLVFVVCGLFILLTIFAFRTAHNRSARGFGAFCRSIGRISVAATAWPADASTLARRSLAPPAISGTASVVHRANRCRNGEGSAGIHRTCCALVRSFALGYACGIIESYLILWFFGIPVSLQLALAVEVLGVLLNNLMFFIPFRVGTQEAGKALVFAMLGLNPAQGLAAGVICRIRELTWAFIGLHTCPVWTAHSVGVAGSLALAQSRSP